MKPTPPKKLGTLEMNDLQEAYKLRKKAQEASNTKDIKKNKKPTKKRRFKKSKRKTKKYTKKQHKNTKKR